VINGRARKIEGNPLHPLNRGKLCARGQAGLQELYNPDRIKNAVRQTGGRGSRVFEPLQWSEALEILTDKMTSLASPRRMAFIGGLMPDHLHLIVSRFLDAIGAPPPILFDIHTAFEGRTSIAKNAQTFFGTQDLPAYDLAHTDVVFSFGANFLETWMSPVNQSQAYGSMRQGQFGGRGMLIQFEPRLSTTAASADEWVPLRPGSEGYVALGIGRIIVEERLGHVGSHRPHATLYQEVDVREMAAASDVPVEDLRRWARIFADADQALAIPGGYLSGQINGTASMLAVQALNLLVAQIGRVGGVFLSQAGPSPVLHQTPRVDPYDRVVEMVESMKAGEVDLLFIHGTNPVFELPVDSGIADGLARVPFVVSFSPMVDETAVRSDLILPEHANLESWGYQVPMPGADRPIVSNQQPVVQPLYDTRSTADIFLSLANRIGEPVSTALPWTDEVAFLQEIASEMLGSSLGFYDARTTNGFWALWQQHGGWWSEKELPREPEVTDIADRPLPVVAPEFVGDMNEYPFVLYPYPSILLTDGRGANRPWLQETPDPMTTARWGTWVELNPETAQSLGVEDNDIVRVSSPFGALEAPAVIYPGIRPDVIAIPVGQGHHDYGRFAELRGVNPLKLLASVSDPESGALAWGATRVQLEKTEEHHKLARLESLDGEGRETLR
jgi:anaerobic selenocysteine-containing dehydrogenase